jgi:mRNA interferase YafQ
MMEKRRYDMNGLFDIITMLIQEEPLPARCREHWLSGTLEGYIECHVKNDWLLLYYFRDGCIFFARTGTHSDLF